MSLKLAPSDYEIYIPIAEWIEKNIKEWLFMQRPLFKKLSAPIDSVLNGLDTLFNIIPYIGPLFGAAFMITLTMISFLGADVESVIVPKSFYVFIGFVIGQIIDNLLSQPFIFSSSIKSHPLEIFLVIIFAGLIAGPLGMLMAIPLYTVLKVVLSEFLSDNRIVRELTKNM